MVPTKRFWLLLALGIPLAALTTALGQPFVAVAYDLLLAALAYASTRLAPPVSNLRLRRKFDPVLSVRVANKITLELHNDGAEAIKGRLRDEPPPYFEASQREFSLNLEPQGWTEFTYTLTPPERGADSFRGTFLRLECPLGLVTRQMVLPSEEPIRVYPNVLKLREFDLLKQQGRLREIGIRRSRSRGLGSEFESLRDYSEGDDFRKVDWKASARRGKLIVRQYEQERNQTVIIAIDIGRHMLAEVNGVRKLDHVLDALLMLTNAAALAGDFVGLIVYSDTVRRYIPPRKGRNQVGMIIEAIHDLIAEPLESDPVVAFSYLASRWNRRSLLVTFTDYDDGDRAKNLALALGPMARRHLTLVVRVSDPHVETLMTTPLAAVGDLYKRAAASLILDDRKAASAILSSSNLHTLDSEPQDLAGNLVSFYFNMKSRSLL